MQKVYQLLTLQDLSLQHIKICFTLPRICHWKFEEDILCPLGPSRVKLKDTTSNWNLVINFLEEYMNENHIKLSNLDSNEYIEFTIAIILRFPKF